MFLCILLASIFILSANAIENNCAIPPNIYNDIGCTAVQTNTSCVESFKCPEFNLLSRSQCHYRGQSYNIGEMLPTTVAPKCFATCKCTGTLLNIALLGGTGYSQFKCNHVPCAGVGTPRNCVRQNTLTQCCQPRTEICGDQVKTLPTCFFQNRNYTGGNVMFDYNNCYKCICDGNFNNATALAMNSNCQRITCNSELSSYSLLAKGCAPIYDNKTNPCCPTNFRCPTITDTVVRVTKYSDNGPTCSYGNLKLNIFDKLNNNPKLKCVSCTCLTPPMVECTIESGCQLTTSSSSSPSSPTQSTSSFVTNILRVLSRL